MCWVHPSLDQCLFLHAITQSFAFVIPIVTVNFNTKQSTGVLYRHLTVDVPFERQKLGVSCATSFNTELYGTVLYIALMTFNTLSKSSIPKLVIVSGKVTFLL